MAKRSPDRSLKNRKRRSSKSSRKSSRLLIRSGCNEDVAYIITDEERKAFKRLNTDEEREQFIEQFWLRRDPTPDTVENEYKEEHYRRIAYANEHYASGIPGWKTDRGRIYIMYGPPDEIESHPSGGSYERPAEEGGGETSTYPFEQWRYRYIEGIGTNIIIEFVDTTMSGEYHMTMDPSEKDALLYVPGAGLTLSEQMGLVHQDRAASTTRTAPTSAPRSAAQPESMNEFSRLEQFAKLQKPPAIKYKDLEASVNTRITFNILPDAGAGRLHPRDEFHRHRQHHDAVREQGSAVHQERRRAEGHRSHARPHHLHDPAPHQHLRAR